MAAQYYVQHDYHCPHHSAVPAHFPSRNVEAGDIPPETFIHPGLYQTCPIGGEILEDGIMKENMSRIWYKLASKGDRSRKTDPQRQQIDLKESKEDSLVLAETSDSVGHSDILDVRYKQKEEDPGPRDLWQAAYDRLEERDRCILSAYQSTAQGTSSDEKENHSKALKTVNEVVHKADVQCKEYQKGGLKIRLGPGEKDINFRDITQRILNAALSFKDVFGPVAVAEPTGLASSAWAIVSLGLTMAQNHNDRRTALFESSEFLANALARCAVVEANFYHASNFETKDGVESAIIQTYTAILRYTAEIQAVQKPNMGKQIQDCVLAITDHPLMQLKSSIKNEEAYLQQWIQMDQNLRRIKEAEAILASTTSIQEELIFSKLPVADGSSFGSYMDQHEDICLPDTRTELRHRIANWGTLPQGKCIFWLKGKAGTGKSTIARTVANSFSEQRLLGASFFFKRGEGDRGNARKLISTITKQLVTRTPQLVPEVSKAIKDDPDVSTKSLSIQFDKLLLQPLLSLAQSNQQTVMRVIVIDALDECEQEDNIRVILHLLSQLQQSSSVHIRIFLTSRPELPIRLGFGKLMDSDHQDLVLDEVPEKEIKHDLFIFLKDRFSKTRQESCLKGRQLPLDWPGDDNIQTLAAMAAPLFIFAATVYRFVNERSPERRLKEILKDLATSPVSKLDGTYIPILNQILKDQNDPNGKVSKELVQEFQEIVGVIVLLFTPLSVNTLAQLLDIHKDDICEQLDSLHSVLSIPDDHNVPIRTLHSSFRDFLLDPETRGKTPFWIDNKDTHQRLAARCLSVCHGLKENICGMPGYGAPRLDIDPETIKQCLSPELQYGCRYWAHHLVESKDLETGAHNAFVFLQEHFLHWVEAMSILGIVCEVVRIIDLLQSAIRGFEDQQLSEFLHDAKRVILKSREAVDDAPLQVYCSALAFAPKMSIVRRRFEHNIPSWMSKLPAVEETWNAELQTLKGHSQYAIPLAFSNDGRLLASTTEDYTAKLWNADTGALQQVLKGHSCEIESVAFSHDSQLLASAACLDGIKIWETSTGSLQQTIQGYSKSVAFCCNQLLASASSYNTVKIWHTGTGILQKTLEGHSSRVRSLASSCNGQLLASASNRTVKVWDIGTDTLKHTLEDHPSHVTSVAISYNGKLLASASDRTVRVWDTGTGALKHSIEGHLSIVESVAFSCNQLLASACDDGNIKLWDTGTGILKKTLDGHCGCIWSVAFSHDGQKLASASRDRTIRLWDTGPSSLQQTPRSHLGDSCWNLIFSHDGKSLASLSAGHTIKLWDAGTGDLQQTLEGHSMWIHDITFSYDGRLLASASYDSRLLAPKSHDETIKLWDTGTGVLHHTLEGHSNSVHSVTFSHDDQLLASASSDHTIKLWRVSSGTLLQTFIGHSGKVNFVAFSADDQLLGSTSRDQTIRTWNIRTGSLQQTFEDHSSYIASVAFSPDGQLLASSNGFSSSIGSYTVKLWDTSTNTLLQTLMVEGGLETLRFSDSSPYLVSNRGGINIQSWYDNYASNPPETGVEVFRGHEWVFIRGKRVLWLPLEFLGYGAFYAGTFAGGEHGGISTMTFRT